MMIDFKPKRPVLALLMLALMALGGTFQLQAQEIDFRISAPNVVAAGERFRIVYSLNAEGKNFKHGKMQGLQVLGGPSLSTSSNVQIINGKVSQSITHSYVFLAVAQKEGEVTLPSATVEVDGETYTAKPRTIKVVAGQSGTANSGAQGTQQGGSVQIDENQLFARVEVSKRNVYRGEPVIATLKIYTRVDLAGFEDIKFPDFTGFWSEEIPTSDNISLEREVVDGEIYNVGVLRKMILFPQSSVPLTIEPMELDCVVRQRVQRRRRSNDPFSMFDDFFGSSSVRTALVKVKSPQVKINIKPLPYDNRPQDFNGAVGDFNFSASLDKDSTAANEPINLKLTLSGKGNLNLIDPIQLDFPSDFEVYDPKTSANIQPTAAGMSGSKTFEYLVIPRHHGTYNIPEVSFSFFNPRKGQYETQTAGPFEVKVARGEGEAAVATAIAGNTVRKENVASIGSDIRYLKTGFILSEPKGYFFGSTAFYLAYLVPALAFGGLLFFWQRKRKEMENIGALKNKKAAKMAKQRLKTAEGFLKSQDESKFYKEVTEAIWGYLSDKLALQRSELTKERAGDLMGQQGVDEATTQGLFKLLDECEFAQFAPSAASGGMDQVYARAVELIMQTDQQIGKKVAVS